ncbi:UPF0120 containing protein [Heterostelium album PN500]|uniref:UPF0120 containing protein n=1 Tax=Heterostelium pallidum (strain ATCC 26659 / Pp 5 / PN500) TaxID=670386 RepID=D3BAJ3_HETP5|nr:UPF0120 containing protein [Heterostelium album PN500]EFA81580.1 UPF0120 containing protein [Heterostelium album PN500]|eukprot:XP_020433697.1 UPF0120 containing protein [Heterostelium album PN500]
MGRANKATKKLDVQALKKQRRTIRKFHNVESKKLKTLTNRRNKRGEDDEDVELEEQEKQAKKNINIVAGEDDDDVDLENYDEDEDEEDFDDEEEEDEEDDDADDQEDKQLFSEKDKKMMNKKTKSADATSTTNEESDPVKSLKGQIAKHRDDLAKLREQDPELFKFLGENESGLLDFGMDDDNEDEEEDEDDDLDEDEEGEGEGEDEEDQADTKDKKKEKKKKQKVEKTKEQEILTSELLDSWFSECEKELTLKSLKKLLLAFKSACHTGMSGSIHTQKKKVDDTRDADSISSRDIPFKIIHHTVFNQTLIVCLQNIPKYLDQLLGYDSTKDESTTRPKLPNTLEKWSTMFTVIRTYIKNLIYLVDQLTDPKMILIALKGLEKVVCYLACFLPSSKLTLKSLLQHWQSSDEAVRIIAFLCIRKMAIHTPYPFIDECLKGVYLTYVRNSKFVSTTSLPIINFMCNCVVEIFSLDFATSYRHAFVYIRQLAIHLRNTLNKLTKESIQNIYNWLYINGLKAWVELIAAHPQQEQLKLLQYPVTQLLIGVIGLTNSGKFFPLRFTCIRMLNRLAESNSLFINTAPYLLELLTTKEFTSDGGATASKNKEINFLTSLSIQDSYINTRSFRDGARDQFALLLVENLNIYSCEIGFPELSIPVILHLKKYIKDIKNVKTIKQMKEIVDAINKQSRNIKNKRDQVRFSPKDTKQVAAFSTHLKEQLGANGNPLTVLLNNLKKKSQAQQEMFVQSTKEYNYEDDQEEQEDDEEMEEDDDQEMEDDEDFEDDDDEEMEEEDEEQVDEEEQKRPAKKTKPAKQSKKVLKESTNDDVVEDLSFSDDE